MRTTDEFAVVDLETTGQSYRQSGKIIQIGITFVRHGRVVERFESFVNPGQLIDRKIQQLTHISQRDVDQAPYFEEIAGILANRLAQTIIVAHNVNFDYPFLNAAFAEAGYPVLSNEAIDTVTLAQVLLPQAPGYRLSDLTNYLNITLTQAHRANADSDATAELFLALWRKAATLPQVVLSQLATGEWRLLRQTQLFFTLMKGQTDLANYQWFDEEQTLLYRRAPQIQQASRQHLIWPETQAARQEMFGRWLQPSRAQRQLMQTVQKILKQRQPFSQIEVAPKVGKTLGYLLPIVFATKYRPVILLTDDLAIQQQQMRILQETISPLLQQTIVVAQLHRAERYLSLEKLLHRLQRVESTQQQLQKARLLVWLTETTTGYLGEIPVPLVPDLLEDLQAQRQQRFDDYYMQAWQRAQTADFWLMSTQTYLQERDMWQRYQPDDGFSLMVTETADDILPAIRNSLELVLPLETIRQQLLQLIAEPLPLTWTKVHRQHVHQFVMQALRISKQLQNGVSDGLIYEFLQVLAQLMNQLDHEIADEYGELYHALKNLLHDWQQWPLVQELPVTARQPEQTVSGWRWEIDPVAVWIQHFQAENAKILVVGETFDVPWLDYVQQLADQSHWRHWQHTVYQTTLPTVQIIPLEDSRLLEHLQALAHFKTLKQITVVMASEDEIGQYYPKVRYALPEWTTVLAQGVQGSREKLYRQLPTYAQSIVFVTPDSLHGQQAQDWTGDVLIWASEELADSRLVKRLSTFLQKRREQPLLVAKVTPVVMQQLGLQRQTVSSEQKLRQQYSQWLGLNE